jgi:aspartyl-tRNA(Asn)/glutamyl-tRNA(Gln) amidotransferase subunit B
MIGLEAHVSLRTRSKLFCGCDADALASPAPNTHVCRICTGQPGAKPRAANAAALAAAVRLARALGMTIQPRARFLRKHYFYPDLASNYQRTSEPIATGGALAGCALWELHVEEDPGAYDPETGRVDYDRSGAPLVEIVSAPELTSPAHARRFLQELRLALGYLDIGRDAAGVKADCNASVGGGSRVEVKNVSGARNVERALAHEVERQRREGALRETRHFDEASGTTRPSRAKETEADYRAFPDPDLAPLDVEALAARVPDEESPFARRARLAGLVGVEEDEIAPLLEERALADLLERNPTRTRYQFLLRDLRAELDHRATTLAASTITPQDVEALLAARETDRIPPAVATRLLRHTFDHKGLGAALDDELRASHTSDSADEAAAATIAANPKAVQDYHAGKPTALNYLLGQAMRHTHGRTPPDTLRAALQRQLQHP